MLPAGIHQDGGGLRFRVEPTGSRSWILRLTINGRSCTKGLGPYPLVTLEMARDKPSAPPRRRATNSRCVTKINCLTHVPQSLC